MSFKLQKEEYEEGLAYDLFRKENIAIAMAYFAVGIVGSLLSTPLNVYLVEKLNAEPQMQNTIGILQTLPWSLKLIFGFISDAFPINGLHRIPYLTIGSLVYSTAFIGYSLYGNDNVINLAICIFFGTLGLIQLDVMSDTMCVQRSKLEPEEQKGQLQSTCYSIRFAGGLVGAILGATICNKRHWGWGLTFSQVAMLNGLIPFILVTPFLFTLREKFHKPSKEERKSLGLIELGLSKHHHKDPIVVIDEHTSLLHDPHAISSGYHSIPHVDIVHESELHTHSSSSSSEKNSSDKDTSAKSPDSVQDEFEGRVEETQTISEQLYEIWMTVQLKSVWRPMAFVFVFNLFQVPNVAWQSYLQLSLNFPSWVLGMTVLLGSFMTFAGVLAYKFFFFKSSWRNIYIWTVMLTAFFSMTQLLLIFQINNKYLHLHNYLFSIGGDVITAYISGIQFLPLCIMYMRLCPDGAEGASYAMLTTFGNIALVCACNLGNILAGVWDVSNDAMRRHDVSGLWKLNLLSSCLSVLPLTLLFLLPKNVEEQDKLSKSKERSKIGGICFLTVLIGSLLWTTLTAVYRVFFTNNITA